MSKSISFLDILFTNNHENIHFNRSYNIEMPDIRLLFKLLAYLVLDNITSVR